MLVAILDFNNTYICNEPFKEYSNKVCCEKVGYMVSDKNNLKTFPIWVVCKIYLVESLIVTKIKALKGIIQ